MASMVHINRSVPAGAAVHDGLSRIRSGIGILKELNGLRAEAIGAGQATMMSVFGTNDLTEAQALSDRWGALLAAVDDTDNAEFAKLRDIINTLVANN